MARSYWSGRLAMALAALLAMAATPASANITYTGHRTITTSFFAIDNYLAPATVDFSLTTDGTLGSIGAANLVAWQFAVSDRFNSATFDQTNSHAEFNFNGFAGQLIATPQDISFNFTDNPGAIVWRTYAGAYSYYCLQCNSNHGLSEIIYVNDAPIGTANRLTGLVSLATATATVTSGAPEPATWAMLILGFGMAGASLRARQRVRFAAS